MPTPRPIQWARRFAKKALSSDLLRANSRRHALWKIGSPRQRTHMPAYLQNEAGLLNQEWTMSMGLGALSLHSLNVLIVTRAQHLAQVGMRAPLPCNGKNIS